MKAGETYLDPKGEKVVITEICAGTVYYRYAAHQTEHQQYASDFRARFRREPMNG